MTEVEADLDGSPDEAKVFLSYSRKDRERASGIADALRARHFCVFKDTDDILPTEEWRDRLQQLIEEADTIVFLLSPHSAVSEVCAWEVEYAHSLNKRIAPIVIEDVEGDAIPPVLARLNFIFCTPRDPFENAVDTLISALNTDIDWIREHTRLAGLAARWEKAGRPGHLLLRGQDIADAEGWRDGRPNDVPAVTSPQAAFVAESRRAAGRRQRLVAVGSLVGLAAAVALSGFAWLQSVEAERQKGVAETNAEEAGRQRAAAVEERDRADQEAARAVENMTTALTALSTQSLAAGDAAAATKMALSAWPSGPGSSVPQTDAALEALVAANGAMLERRRVPFDADVTLMDFDLSHDGRWLIVGGVRGKDISVHLTEIATETSRILASGPFRDEDGYPFAVVAVGREGRIVGAMVHTGDVVFWRTVDDKELFRLDPGGRVEDIAIAGRSGRIVIAVTPEDGDGFGLEVDVRDWTVRRSEFGSWRGLKLSAGGGAMAFQDRFGVTMRPSAFADLVRVGRENSLSASFSFSQSGRHAAHASVTGEVDVVRVEDGERIFEFRTRAPGTDDETPLYPVAAFGPDDRLLAVSRSDGSVRLHEMSSGSVVLTLPGREEGQVVDLAFSEDGGFLIAVDALGEIRVWEIASHAPVATFGGPRNCGAPVAFSGDGAAFAYAQAYLF